MNLFPANVISKLYKDHPKFIFFLFVLLIISNIIFPLFSYGKGQSDKICKSSANATCSNTSAPSTLGAEQNNCTSELFKENLDQWNTQYYYYKDSDYWCPITGFNDPVMWNKNQISPNFKEITVEYEIKQRDKNSTIPRSLIVQYGDKKPIFKLWTNDGETQQLFRFAKANTDFSDLIKENAFELPDPVKDGQPNIFKILTTNINGTDIALNFIFNYTSSKINIRIPQTISKNIKVPVSDATSTLEKFPFGIGTYNGNCIRPISFKLCR